MKCYNHAENDAVGVCKNCSKGLCKECLTEVNNGIACTLTCIEEVERIDKLIKKGSQSYKTVYASQMRNAYLIGSMGIVFIFFGITMDGITGFLTIMGIIFIIGSVFNVINAKKYKQEI